MRDLFRFLHLKLAEDQKIGWVQKNEPLSSGIQFVEAYDYNVICGFCVVGFGLAMATVFIT